MSKVAVVYWSGTGNTEAMAYYVTEGAKAAGAEVDVFTSAEFSADKAGEYPAIAFGCPSMGAEQLEESEFEPMFEEVKTKLGGKRIGLFGSYGWGGQANGQIEEELKKCGFDICLETLKIQYIPSEEQLKELSEKIKSLK